MKYVNSWNLTNNKLHQLFKNNDNSYQVIYENDVLNPWKLILKK